MRDTIVITGSRVWDDLTTISIWLDHFKLLRVVHGAAKGADRLAGLAAVPLGYNVEVYPVGTVDGPWPMAGHNRNYRMVEANKERAAVGLAFVLPDTKERKTPLDISGGTFNCIGVLLQFSIPPIIIKPGMRPCW